VVWLNGFSTRIESIAHLAKNIADMAHNNPSIHPPTQSAERLSQMAASSQQHSRLAGEVAKMQCT
jgi:hypothetical protein